MKPRWVDIHVRAKTDAPLDLVRNLYKLNREVNSDDVEGYKYYDIEVHQVSVQVVKEGR